MKGTAQVQFGVDVVIPTYNQAEFLREALLSLTHQQHQNWHALVINNMSSDHTKSVISDLNDSRIELIDYNNSGIIAASRNLGIRRSANPFIAFLDSDDRWHPLKLGLCIDELAKGFDLVCHAENWVSDSSSRVVRYGPACRTSYAQLLMRGNCLSTSAIVGRSEMFRDIGGFSERPEFVTAEDYDLWLRLAKAGYRFAITTEVLGDYRIHYSSASASVERNFNAEKSVVDFHFHNDLIDSVAKRRVRHARSHYFALRTLQRLKRDKEAVVHATKSLLLWPFSIKSLAALLLSVLRLAVRSAQR